MKSSPYLHCPSGFLTLIPCQCLREDVRRNDGSFDVVVLHNLPWMQFMAIVVAYLICFVLALQMPVVICASTPWVSV